jgi:uncharacterized protein (TIGR00251 family)
MTAIRPSGTEAVCIDVHVEPGSSRPGIGPYDLWRQRIQVRVGSPATSGKANKELVQLFADLFDVGTLDVVVERGATTRRKSIRVTGVSLETVQTTLADLMGPAGD